MPQSLSKVYVHITFSTKNRQYLIDDAIKNSLFDYLGGICRSLDCNPLKVGGCQDHIHVICMLSRKVAQMTLLEELKKQSSKWIKTKGKEYADFYWQSGYGIFSVNPTETEAVVDYILNQEEHHKKVTFQDEYRAFLKKYKVEYDERYVWD
jgi:Transposase and inactivated derivatives